MSIIETGLHVRAKGISYPVGLDAEGYFTATVATQEIRAASFSQLSVLAKKAAEGAAKLSVPFIMFSYANGQTSGTVTGVHATQHRTVLIRWADGAAGPVALHNMSTILRPLGEAESAELSRLAMVKADATRELDEFLKPRKLDLWEAAQAAATGP